MKYCGKCKTHKPINAFTRDGSRVDGLSNKCRSCTSTYSAKYRIKNKTKIANKKRVWYLSVVNNHIQVKSRICIACHKDKPIGCFCKHKYTKSGSANTCKQCDNSKHKSYYRQNTSVVKARTRAWSKAHPDVLSASKRSWKKRNPGYATQYIRTNLQARLVNNLRKALHNGQKVGSAVRDLGCSISQLKHHLESRFQPGMSWGNYGQWHIDHIKPLDGFDLTNRAQFLRACHFTNLQPLWKTDNLSKGIKLAA